MKILVTDLDGTLFYPKDKKAMICKENLDFVRNFIDKGNKRLNGINSIISIWLW